MTIGRVVLGNIISIGASFCLIMSCIEKKQKSAYAWQMGESIFLTASSVCFQAWAGAFVLILSIVRNWLAMNEKFTVNKMKVFAVLSVIAGLYINTKGWIGMMPVVANVQLTYCNYRAKTILEIKWSFFINIIIWTTYSFMIFDFVSGTTQLISGIICMVSIYKLIWKIG